MQKLKQELNANPVGANCVRSHFEGMTQNKGITLIALIITIIVMLILVGVTINVALNGGLFSKAETATKQTEEKAILEEMLAMMYITDKGKINYNAIITKMEEKYGEEKVKYTYPNVTITGKLGIYNYIVSETEIKIGSANQEDLEILQRYFLGEIDEITGKRPGIDITTLVANPEVLEDITNPRDIKLKNNDILNAYTDITIIGMDESSVYIKYNNNIYNVKMDSQYVCNMVEYAYKDEFRAILQDVSANPEKYLKEAQALGQSEELTDIGIGTDGKVVNLSLWNFEGGSFDTKYMGEFNPDGTIEGTIPQYIYSDGGIYEVNDIKFAFYNCTELKIAPEIPETVTSLEGTFWGCSNLTTAPVIPNLVKSLYNTFEGCSNLTGYIIINSDIIDSLKCLGGVGSAERPIVLKGTGNNLEILEAIKATGNSEYITIEQ